MSFEDDSLVKAIKANSLPDVQKILNSGTAQTDIRDQDGKTLLHVVIESNASADIFKHLLDEVDVGIRDKDGNSVAELAFSEKTADDVQQVLINFLRLQILSGNMDELHKLALSGWSVWPVSAELSKNLSKEVADFIEKLPEFQKKVAGIHKAIQDDSLRDLKNSLDRKIFLQAADRTGLLPLHKAVVFRQTDIALFMANEYKQDALNLQDNMGRTPLHYAGGSHDAGNLYEEFTKAGADETITDLSGNTPKVYYEDPTLLSVMDVKKNVLEILDRPLINVQREKSAKKTCQMYISSELKPRDVPPPTTVDGKYVAQHLGTALTLALADIAECRPWDPIEYLGQWLHKYGENQKYVKRQEELLIQIKKEEEEKQIEMEQKQKIREEQKELQEIERKQREKEEEERRRKEQEELQRKAKEAALAQQPNLETVPEEGELEESASKEKDVSGQTELHKLAAQEGTDMTGLIKLGYSISDRDANNKTPRDIAEDSNIEENVQAIDSYVRDLIEKENFDAIQQLMVDGYDHLQAVLDKLSTEGQTQEVTNFISSIPEFQEKLKSVLMASQFSNSNTESVKQALETPKLVQARDQYGRCPLHLAVLADQKEIVEHIVTVSPASVKAKDNMNRTPLHYAKALSEEIASLLTTNGADSEARDVNNRNADYYRNNPDDIQILKNTFIAPPPDATSEGQDQVQDEDQGQDQVQGQDQTQDDDSQQNSESMSDEQQSQQTTVETSETTQQSQQ